MRPILVTHRHSCRRGWRHAWIAIGPLIPDEMVVLLLPHHRRESLPLDVSEVVSHGHWADAPKELIRFTSSLFNDFIKQLLVQIALVLLRESKSYDSTFAWWNTIFLVEGIPGSTLSTFTMWVDCTLFSNNDKPVKGIFDIWLRVLRSIKGIVVGVILSENDFRLSIQAILSKTWWWGELEESVAKFPVFWLCGQ